MKYSEPRGLCPLAFCSWKISSHAPLHTTKMISSKYLIWERRQRVRMRKMVWYGSMYNNYHGTTGNCLFSNPLTTDFAHSLCLTKGPPGFRKQWVKEELLDCWYVQIKGCPVLKFVCRQLAGVQGRVITNQPSRNDGNIGRINRLPVFPVPPSVWSSAMLKMSGFIQPDVH